MKRALSTAVALTLGFCLVQQPSWAQRISGSVLTAASSVTAQPILIGRGGRYKTAEDWARIDAQSKSATSRSVIEIRDGMTIRTDSTSLDSVPAIPLRAGNDPNRQPQTPPSSKFVKLIVSVKKRGEDRFQAITFPKAEPSFWDKVMTDAFVQAGIEGLSNLMDQQKAYEAFANRVLESYNQARDVYGQRAGALGQAAEFEVTRSRDMQGDLLAAAASYGSVLPSEAPEGLSEQALAEAILNDPLAYRHYELSPAAAALLAEKIDKLLKGKSYRKAAASIEQLSYNAVAETAKSSLVNDENIIEFERANPSLPLSPLSKKTFATDKDSPFGQVVRRVANAYQAAWAQTSALKSLNMAQRLVYLDGLLTLNEADQALATPGQEERGSGLLVASLQLVNGIFAGFNQEIVNTINATTKHWPELLESLGGIGNAMFHYASFPDQAIEAAIDFGNQLPGMLEQQWYETARYLSWLGDASPYEKGKAIGGFFGVAASTLASEGIANELKAAGATAEAAAAAQSLEKAVGLSTDAYAAARVGTHSAQALTKLEQWSAAVARAERPGTRAILEKFVLEDAYLATMRGQATELAKAGWRLSEEKLMQISARAEDLSNRLPSVAPKIEIVKVTRGLRKDFVEANMRQGMSMTEAVFAKHPSMVENVNRMTIGGDAGIAGIYTSDSVATATAELRNNVADIIFAQKEYRLEKVLDLTDAATLERLGLKSDEISTKLNRTAKHAYETPQILGLLAESNGFDAIKYDSAQRKAGTNWVILRK